MAKRKYPAKVGSLLSGFGVGVLISLWLNLVYSFNYSRLIYMLLFIPFFVFLAFKTPKKIEIFAYALSIYVFLQMAWDFSVGDRGPLRMSLFLSALILLIINSFSGYYGWGAPIKVLKKALGL